MRETRGYVALVFRARFSMGFRQISADPSTACARCSFSELINSSIASGLDVEMSVWLSERSFGFALYPGHHLRRTEQARKIRSEWFRL